ncbi:MAG TPA: hypothetical protein VE732_04835 [Nitrososphaera sp.]|nr:hypothetical protein [Nitrososphaera sp.]
MKKYAVKFKRWLRLMLQPKAILIGVTILNFTVVYLQAKEAEEAPGIKFCFGAPWYLLPLLSNFPLLLLLAAITSYLGRWWSYLMAVAFCAPVVYLGAVDIWRGLTTDSGLTWLWYEPLLLLQYVLAAALMSMAVSGLAREVRR